MYKVKMDGQVLYYPGDKEAVLTAPTVNLQTGYAGTFEFTVPPINPLYDKIQNRRSMVSVFRDSTEIFYGEVRKTAESRQIQKQERVLRRRNEFPFRLPAATGRVSRHDTGADAGSVPGYPQQPGGGPEKDLSGDCDHHGSE